MIFLIGVGVTLFAWALIALGVVFFYFIIPLLIILAIILFSMHVEKKKKQADTQKMSAVYAEQLKSFCPEARFFLDVQPLKDKICDGVEQRVERRNQIAAIAKQHGIDMDTWKGPQVLSVSSGPNIYYAGYTAILKAQKDFLLQFDDGLAMIFYLYLREHDGYAQKQGIRGLVEIGFHCDEVSKALNACNLANIPLTGSSSDFFATLSDDHQLLAIQTFDAGKAAYKKLEKARKKDLPPYYFTWLFTEECRCNNIFV